MEKVFRSLIKKYFPNELLLELEEISLMHDIDNNGKTPFIIEALNKYNVPYTTLGNGTNRYGILVDGFAVKIALDKMGHTDNKREFKYSKRLYPLVVKVYECVPNGLVATFEYLSIFSIDDFIEKEEEMREILKIITDQFLVGDIGISNNNYINWGTRSNGEIAILDFAYIYSLSFQAFQCSCENEGTLQYDENFNYLICPFCHKKYQFKDIRKRISKQAEIDEIGDIRTLGYNLHKDEEVLKVDLEKSPYLKPKKKKTKKKQPYEDEDRQNNNLDPDEQLSNIHELDKALEKYIRR